ncbi:MAG: hypothetical protein Q9157_008185 [Trypethelium eluteriae]
MRPAVRLLAAVKPQFLETGTPTGLTGLFTHPTPRGTLSYLYNSTLDKLQRIPESSVYRQSTEALVKHRLSIVDSMEPEGYEAWQERVKKQLEENKDLTGPHGIAMLHSHGGNQFITSRHKGEVDERIEEWDGAEDKEPELEGTRSKEERAIQFQKLAEEAQKPATGHMEIEPEPQLTKAQYVVGDPSSPKSLEVHREAGLVLTSTESKKWRPRLAQA